MLNNNSQCLPPFYVYALFSRESVAYLYSLWTNVFVCAGLGVACCESVGCETTLGLPAVVVLLLLLLLLPTTGVNGEL